MDFEGDVLLIDSPDGGELVIENWEIKNDKHFSTAVYLSLFGGNQDDPGKTEHKRTYWANLLVDDESEKLRSRFQYIINGFPMTSKYIREAETAAQLDLEWIKKDKIADEIIVSGHSINKTTFNLDVEILADREQLYKNTFSLQWEGEKNHAL